MTLLLLGAGKQTVAGGAAAPLFSSAEIGTVDASTLVVTFDQDVSAADYGAGVTIKVNGSATSITSATRQANHAIVRYVIPVLWHGSGDAVTWEYSGGDIVAESGGASLADVAAQSVMNNCEYEALLDLQADTLALADNDPVSTWADQSGNGRDFTQSGDARPTKQTIGGYSTATFDGVDDWLLGNNFADNLEKFCIFAIVDTVTNSGICVISKSEGGPGYSGWMQFLINDLWIGDSVDSSVNYLDIFKNALSENVGVRLYEYEKLSNQTGHLYINGNNSGEEIMPAGTISSFSTSAPVRIGLYGDGSESEFYKGNVYAIAIYQMSDLTNWQTANRAALEARLAARYGVTL